jgi:hypothetical protein
MQNRKEELFLSIIEMHKNFSKKLKGKRTLGRHSRRWKSIQLGRILNEYQKMDDTQDRQIAGV